MFYGRQRFLGWDRFLSETRHVQRSPFSFGQIHYSFHLQGVDPFSISLGCTLIVLHVLS